MTRISLFGLAIAIALASSPLFFSEASAGAENLRCNRPFKKVRTYSSSIKCKAVETDLRSQSHANVVAKQWIRAAGCNAHSSPPKNKVWKKKGKWTTRVTFTCAIIY